MFSDDNSAVYWTDQVATSSDDMHYIFEVPDCNKFLQAWMGEGYKQSSRTYPIKMTLNFRDNADFENDRITIVRKGGTQIWDAIEEDTPEVHKFTALNSLGTLAYFVHDPFAAPVIRDTPEESESLMDKNVFLIASDIMEQPHTVFTIGVDYVGNVHESQNANMGMDLYSIKGLNVTYVALSPTINSMERHIGKKKIEEADKYQNRVNAINLMHKFCAEGLLEPMTQMPLQFIQDKLKSSPVMN